jgi:hypothetical protein
MTEQHLAPHKIALALQGGGSHGAFTWGVLDRMLDDPAIKIVGATGNRIHAPQQKRIKKDRVGAVFRNCTELFVSARPFERPLACLIIH